MGSSMVCVMHVKHWYVGSVCQFRQNSGLPSSIYKFRCTVILLEYEKLNKISYENKPKLRVLIVKSQ